MIKLIRGSLLIAWLGFWLLVADLTNKMGLLSAKRELYFMVVCEVGREKIFPYMFENDELFRKVEQ